MHVQFKIEGGIAFFPGLSKPRNVDSDKLSPQDASELARLVEAAHFFDLPGQVGKAPPGAADYRQYIVTIADGKRNHTVRVIEPVEDTNLQAMLNFIQSHA